MGYGVGGTGRSNMESDSMRPDVQKVHKMEAVVFWTHIFSYFVLIWVLALILFFSAHKLRILVAWVHLRLQV